MACMFMLSLQFLSPSFLITAGLDYTHDMHAYAFTTVFVHLYLLYGGLNCRGC